MGESRQCSVIRQLAMKLKLGGRAWFGGNSPWGVSYGTHMKERLWVACLKALAKAKKASFNLNFIHDRALFRADIQDFGELPGDFLYLQHTFSVFVTRRA